MHQFQRGRARQTAYVGVSAIMIAEEYALHLFVECRMFVQVKALQQTAVRLPGRFNHVANNSAVISKEDTEKDAGDDVGA